MATTKKTAKQIVTIYFPGAFGGRTIKGTNHTIKDGQNGQYVEYTPVGKRKATYESRKSLVVLDGDHPPTPTGLDTTTENGMTCERSRYASFDPRYDDEHNIHVNSLIAAGATVLIDRRTDAEKNTTTVRTILD